ncbi:MAG: cellobiose phosphorylase [Candidatus Omnitrophica bacterium]|nr:cellobiose phosphorylase [Candidatus Omnitrophota bacterium]
MATSRLNHDAFLVEGYTRTRPFASFLPGIAGLLGIPLWAFYVNRGQAIAGFGIQDKEHPIMEFLPANRAYHAVPLQGFRTFIKIRTGKHRLFHEPFQNPGPDASHDVVQRMRIRMHELELEEEHRVLRLDTRVRYFTIPHASFAALARVLTLTNRGPRPIDLELLDGLPVIVPYGMVDRFLKHMSRTIEAWVSVQNLERRAPLYHLRVEPHDRPEVVPIRAGNFSVALTEDGGSSRLLEPVIDPAVVFGCREDGAVPERFLDPAFRIPARQLAADRMPCAMSFLRCTLRPGESRTVYALFGHMPGLQQLNAALPAIATPAFFETKAAQNAALIEDVTRPIATASGMSVFDRYCRQTFLDNALRGGIPVSLGADGTPGSLRRKIVYVFSRKHGDLERDYNQFVIPATPYSQGDANYRDVNQNRRSDAWFYPHVGDTNIVAFFNLLQADGFNPLVFKGLRFTAPEELRAIPALREILSKPFTPGELLDDLARHNVKTGESHEAFLQRVLGRSQVIEDAEHGEGFWTDHWTYNLDLLESYLALYPDRLRELLLERHVFTFHDNAHVVAPRAKRYHLVKGALRQVRAVRWDREKSELIQSRHEEPNRLRAEHGRGGVYATTLLVKMVSVIANKLASLDPSGLGIEMEADKPNWHDALNGLPALLGSSLCETWELKRWMQFLLDALAALRVESSIAVPLPEELTELLASLLEASLEAPPQAYWEAANAAKEAYRERIRLGLSGREEAVTLDRLVAFLHRGIGRLSEGIERSVKAGGELPPSYFYHEASGYTQSGPVVTPARWRLHTLPPFLSGAVHALRQEPDPKRARALYQAVRRSALYDRRLKMYRVCASLEREPEEIGRCRVFTPGWLENQSIWLHMEYKFLLELLRCGLHEEFYENFFQALIPFQPPARYGRSILENSSFLVSSVYPDRSLHGAGFVARLSGATAEFIQIWLWMTAGRSPFRLDRQGRLELQLVPVLHGKLFDRRGRFSFTFLGRIRVTYHNPQRRATFGPGRARPDAIRLTPRSGEPIDCAGGVIPAPYAERVRAGDITAIDVQLAAPRRP